MNSSVLMLIEEQYPKLSKSHKRIADYILNNYEKAAFLTAAKLGQETGISESTAVRFATQLGFEGYPEFQSNLQETIRGKLTSTQRMEVASIHIWEGDLLENVMMSDRQTIKDTLESVSREDFQGAAEAINQAKTIYILGVRSTAPLANFIYFYFKLIYDNVKLITAASSSEMYEEIFKISDEDVCLALSFPRYSRQVIKTLRYVHSTGAKIIAITDSEQAPIAELSDYLLVAKNSMVSFVDSMVAPLSLIDALIVASARERREDVQKTFLELDSVWDNYNVYETSGDLADE